LSSAGPGLNSILLPISIPYALHFGVGVELADNVVLALALLVAEGNPKQKELMIRLVLNLFDSGR
jgi:hypothetical protein